LCLVFKQVSATLWGGCVNKTVHLFCCGKHLIKSRKLRHTNFGSNIAFVIFGQKREKAIELCLNRFDIDTKNSFLDLYKKLDETIAPPVEQSAVEITANEMEISF